MQQLTNGKYFSQHLECVQCHTLLPTHASFCSFCGNHVNSQEDRNIVILEPHWVWPIIVILFSIAILIVTFIFTDSLLRPLISFCFLSFCPGISIVRFLHLKDPVVEWVLAIALSFTIDTAVATTQLYMGWWSPVGTLSILLCLSFGASIVHIVSNSRKVMRRVRSIRPS